MGDRGTGKSTTVPATLGELATRNREVVLDDPFKSLIQLIRSL
jgi:predicted AAA+ superfamily ATPase